MGLCSTDAILPKAGRGEPLPGDEGSALGEPEGGSAPEESCLLIGGEHTGSEKSGGVKAPRPTLVSELPFSSTGEGFGLRGAIGGGGADIQKKKKRRKRTKEKKSGSFF